MKPILFNTEMVKSILKGDKTVTRRVVKPRHGGTIQLAETLDGTKLAEVCEDGLVRDLKPPYKAGDILYVRETWNHYLMDGETKEVYFYKASPETVPPEFKQWRPSIHMPKKAARIFLKVTDVKVQRLQGMTEEDVFLEGAGPIIDACEHMDFSVVPPEPCFNVNPCKNCIIDKSYPELFGEMVWNPTVKEEKYKWESSPWVWVIKFEKSTKKM